MSAAHQKTKRRVTAAEKPDIAVAEAFAPVRDSTAVEFLGGLSEFSDQPPLYAAAGGVIAAGLATGDARTLRFGARMLAAHVAAILLKNLFKRAVDRTRPALIADEGRYELTSGERFDHQHNSFPSGHTASAFAVARAFGREYPQQERGALVAAGLLSGTQVVRSTHYVSDVIAGAAIGIIAEAVSDRALRPLLER